METGHERESAPEVHPVRARRPPVDGPVPGHRARFLELQCAAGNRAVTGLVTGSRSARTVVQRVIDGAHHPDVVLTGPIDLQSLRAYVAGPVNRHGETFTRIVEDTIREFPAEAEQASLAVWWGNVRYLLRRTDPPDAAELDLCRRYLPGITVKVNDIHAAVGQEILGVARAPRWDEAVKGVLKSVPLAARSLSVDVLWSNIGHFAERLGGDGITVSDLRLCRDYVTMVQGRVRKLRSLVEPTTRMGFEIETGNHFVVKPRFKAMAESLINVTLATTDALEFLIDDIREESGEPLVQIEFRTRPFKNAELAGGKPADLKKKIDESIRNFPVRDFGTTSGAASAALESAGWEGTAALARLAPGLRILGNANKVTPKKIQHVTHSIPVSSYLKLTAGERKELIPGSEKAKSVEQLLEFFLTAKILPQSSGGTIVVTTTGRNTHSPNVKSGLDTIAGYLPPRRFERLMGGKFGQAPDTVKVESSTGTIERPSVHEGLPDSPSLNIHEGRAHLSSEEKLKPVLFDPEAEDIRVLVEHRGGPLVAAVQKAMAGQPGDLAVYLKIFRKLDDAHGDGTFERWFR
ncbi:hypothetical protein AB0J55_16665 [Amycolatopsis sp. NPDC049688]|uniref:hypothetical protein n=1 Tax=Amycolatopsis sp. NPDC049688 TaxID=3154733 RepID=UPI0034476552